MFLTVSTYSDSTKQYVVEQETISFTPLQDIDSLRWDKQGYDYIKTLPKYADAVDC